MSGNKITDLTPLANLTNLQLLFLAVNGITDVTPLAGLTNLIAVEPGRSNLLFASGPSLLLNSVHDRWQLFAD